MTLENIVKKTKSTARAAIAGLTIAMAAACGGGKGGGIVGSGDPTTVSVNVQGYDGFDNSPLYTRTLTSETGSIRLDPNMVGDGYSHIVVAVRKTPQGNNLGELVSSGTYNTVSIGPNQNGQTLAIYHPSTSHGFSDAQYSSAVSELTSAITRHSTARLFRQGENFSNTLFKLVFDAGDENIWRKTSNNLTEAYKMGEINTASVTFNPTASSANIVLGFGVFADPNQILAGVTNGTESIINPYRGEASQEVAAAEELAENHGGYGNATGVPFAEWGINRINGTYNEAAASFLRTKGVMSPDRR